MIQLDRPASTTPSGNGSALLADDHRRLALELLRERDRPLALADLAADIVRAERGGDPTDPDYETIRRCRLALHHRHVPKLVDAGVVQYDPETRTARYAARDALGAGSGTHSATGVR